VAVVPSRFPKLSETFVLDEILALERRGERVAIFPLLAGRERVVHPDAEAPARAAQHARLLSIACLRAQARWLLRAPHRYLATWARVLWGNRRSPGFLARAAVVVPKAALMAVRMEQAGVRHVHASWASHPALAAYVVGALTGIPYSFEAHAHDLYVDRSMLGEKLRRAAFAVTISDFNRRMIERLYGSEAASKTHVVRCGIDLAAYAGANRRGPGPLLEIAAVGSLQDYKGHEHLVRACGLLHARGVPLRCRIAGEGEERAALEHLIARLGLEREVLLLGGLPREQVRDLLRDADVVAQPSVVTPSGKTEGIPVALMEALAMGVPVVASRVSGVPELVEHGRTGMLVAPGDPLALAIALRRVHSDPVHAARLAAAGRERVREHHDLGRNAAALATLIGRP
jgi:glycosyltransferase involved in cell wall biosynthesis